MIKLVINKLIGNNWFHGCHLWVNVQKVELLKSSQYEKDPLKREEKTLYTVYIYIHKDGNRSTKSTKHVETNVNTQEKNQNNQNSINEVEDLNLKGHPLIS